MLKTIKFNKNHNGKLNNDVFTTIRKQNYGIALGDCAAIVLMDKVYKWVECVGVTTQWYADLSPVIIACDTGICDETVHILFNACGIHSRNPATMVDLLVLKTIPRPKHLMNPETQVSLSSLWENVS